MFTKSMPTRRRTSKLSELSVVSSVKLSSCCPLLRRTSTGRRQVALIDLVGLDALVPLKIERVTLRSLSMPNQTSLECLRVVSLEQVKRQNLRLPRLKRKARRTTPLSQLTQRKDGSPEPTFKISCSHILVKNLELKTCHLWLATVI